MNGYSAYLWAILASCCAIFFETYCRGNPQSWVQMLPITAIPMVLLNYAIFRLLRVSDSLLSAFVVFSFSNLILRTGIVVLYLNEHVTRGTWLALGLLVLAQFSKIWIK